MPILNHDGNTQQLRTKMRYFVKYFSVSFLKKSTTAVSKSCDLYMIVHELIFANLNDEHLRIFISLRANISEYSLIYYLLLCVD